MYYTYVLRSLLSNKLYTGYSANLRGRIKKHKSKGVHTTKRMGELELIFYEAFKSRIDTKRREKYFKTTKGKRSLRLMLRHSLKN